MSFQKATDTFVKVINDMGIPTEPSRLVSVSLFLEAGKPPRVVTSHLIIDGEERSYDVRKFLITEEV